MISHGKCNFVLQYPYKVYHNTEHFLEMGIGNLFIDKIAR